VIRLGQLCPDGVVIAVNWDKFEVGSSVFIPAINLAELEKQVRNVAIKLNFQIKSAERIENSKLGMRFWRIL
jgi:hypothetical protein